MMFLQKFSKHATIELLSEVIEAFACSVIGREALKGNVWFGAELLPPAQAPFNARQGGITEMQYSARLAMVTA